MISTIEKELAFTNNNVSFKPKELPNWYGIEGVGFVWHNSWSDPEIEYKGKRINSYIVEDTMWERFREDCEEQLKEPNYDNFDTYMKEHAEDVYELIELAMEGM